MIYHQDLSKARFQSIAADIIAAHVLGAAAGPGRAGLFLSGGSTPGPIYETLSCIDLPWDKVNVGLVDERWVDEHDTGSNAALLRRTLLQDKAGTAYFTPMKTAHNTPQDGQADVETNYNSIVSENSLAVLGMGTDGHVCSWFPGSAGLGACVDPMNGNLVQAVTANKSNVTGDYLERMTLTLTALTRCRTVLLLITGAEKREVLETALEDANTNLPVSHLLPLENLVILHAA